VSLGPVAEHAVGHGAMALPFVILVVLVQVVWPAPPPTSLGRAGRVVLVVGLAAFGGGAALEAVGALGYTEPEPNAALSALHDIGVYVTLAGLPILLLGVILSIASAALWSGWIRRRWFWAAVTGFAVLVTTYLMSVLVIGI
jgi:hypothetical protein